MKGEWPMIYASKYVSYKGKPYLVLETSGDIARIVNPNLTGSNKNLSVNVSKLTELKCSNATLVNIDMVPYMVTPKGIIYSLHTYREMKWGPTHPQRKKILALAKR